MKNVEEFTSYFQNASNKQMECVEILKRAAKNGILTVLYGAGAGALQITEILKKHGIKVNFYLVDDEYLGSDNNIIKEAIGWRSLYENGKPYYLVMTSRTGVQERIGRLAEKELLQEVLYFDWDLEGLYEPMTLDYIKLHSEEFFRLYQSLSDELSKETLMGYLKTKLTLDPQYLWPVWRGNQYFCQDIYDYDKNEIIVDGGAYTGDTLNAFCARKYAFKKYYAFEPDAANVKKLEKLCEGLGLKNVQIENQGLWSRQGSLFFKNEPDSSGSLISDTGEIQVSVTSIDGMCPDASFIKLDVEGSELEALRGGEKTILRNKPKLAICVYHKREDLLEISAYIKKLVPEYRLYLKQHCRDAAIELVLYAVV